MRANGSMDSGGGGGGGASATPVDGSPNIGSLHLHQNGLLWRSPMTLQGFFSSLITPSAIVPWDLTGLVV